ncbi:MAG: hypothetical protein ABSE28_19395 [Candidatus Sulfotelmatobacter sp.]|jgi:hypothetical protein
MPTDKPEMPVHWFLSCDSATFEACKKDKKFPHLVALARAVNALKFIDSTMELNDVLSGPTRFRDRMNTFFFASAILYEVLVLIRKMSQAFRDDEEFRKGLHRMSKSKAAREIENQHLRAVRNRAVFHFDASAFGDVIATGNLAAPFVNCVGHRNDDIHYAYADLATAAILVGSGFAEPKFSRILETAMRNIRVLTSNFVTEAELLIATHLLRLGFVEYVGKPTGFATPNP